MQTDIVSEQSQLYRLTLATSRRIGAPVDGFRADGQPACFFVANEVLVNAAETELIDGLVRQGGRIGSAPDVPPLPEEFRRLGLGRPEGEVDPAGQPRIVDIQFDDVPAAPPDADTLLAAVWPDIERMEWSSDQARALAALIAASQAEGRHVSLNYVLQPRTLPLIAPQEGSGLVYPPDPLQWPTMNQQSRIADAWYLVESMRLMRSVSPIEFVGICDTGFAPRAGGDITVGGLQWNADGSVQGLPAGDGIDFHGTEVAGAATAIVGNAMGTAGSGGTVAMPAYFHAATINGAMRAVVRCTYWGIRTVNISRGLLFSQAILDLHLDWRLTFEWAADNGVLVVCGAPNEHVELSGNQGDWPSTVSDRLLAVGNLRTDDTPSDCAYGSGVDLWAPGTNIPLIPTAANPMGSWGSGTSYAAPLVSGVAAMMRAVNPALGPDQLRDILLKTSWPVAGSQARGMNAYAAVLEAMRAGVAENSFETPTERLYTAADGSFKPIFNDGFNRAGDIDTFTFDVTRFSQLVVSLRWYNRITKVTFGLENAATGKSVDMAVSQSQGLANLTADVGSGTYRLTVQGTGTSAYLLNGRIVPGVLRPDRFEPNDSFETATPLRVLPRGKWEIGGMLAGPWGPGTFELNLHTDGIGPATRDVDYFVIHVPAALAVLQEAEIRISDSDEPMEIVLFDASRTVLNTRHLTRQSPSVTVTLPLGKTVYLKISATTHTRYRLWVGSYQHDAAFRKLWPEVRPLPHWWEQHFIDTFAHPEEQRSIVITPELIADKVLTLGGDESHPLPEGLQVSLLNRDGTVVREATAAGDRVIIHLDGIPEGGYVLHANLSGAALDAARAGGLRLAMRPPAST